MSWITENVLWQDSNETFGTVVGLLTDRYPSRRPPDGLLHVLHPFTPRSTEEQDVVHETTESHLVARRLAGDGVTHLAVTFPDERALADPRLFDAQLFVERHGVPDGIGPGSRPRVFEILETAADAALPAEYLIYTNFDICLQPAFYDGVRRLLALGADALIINRRTVHDWSAGDEARSLAQFEVGDIHPGMDCFVFPRRWVGLFEPTTAILGHGHVMRGVLYNLVAHADALVVLTNVAMTYHHGDDRPWTSDASRPQFDAHVAESERCFDALCANDARAGRLHAFVEERPKYRPSGGT